MTPPKDPIRYKEFIQKMSDINKGKHYSSETRKKIGDAHRGERNFNFGKHLSEETRKKLSEAHKQLIGVKSWRFGKPLSEEHRKHIGAANKGKHGGVNNPNYGRPMPKSHRTKIGDANRGKRCGEISINWKGGTSFEPYCPKFNKYFKERVRAFFGYTCIECGVKQQEKKLAIHHVTFNKKTCCDGSTPLFVPLCPSCHTKTNHNRVFWEYWFTEMINLNHGGKCYLSQGEYERRRDEQC